MLVQMMSSRKCKTTQIYRQNANFILNYFSCGLCGFFCTFDCMISKTIVQDTYDTFTDCTYIVVLQILIQHSDTLQFMYYKTKTIVI